jgi:glycosyltransferase involved in cell wall biosynthesis
MARYLPDLGYEPVVLTAPRPAEERWTPTDNSLGSGLPPHTIVRRVPGPEPPSSTGWRHRAERWLRLRDPWTRSWVEASTSAGIEAARELDVDLVYAWMQPYHSAEAAMRIARAIDRPWVADLGDPWALDEMMIYPSGLHRRLELRLMRRLLGTASAIVMSTPEAERRIRAAFPEFEDRIVLTIPNGFDATEFLGEPPARTDGAFRIVHTGYLHTELGQHQRRSALLRRLLGGAVEGVDILGRSHVFLIEAVERIRREYPELGRRIEVYFAGVLSSRDLAVARRSPAARTLGFLAHDESLRLARSADLLFLPMHDLPEGTRATVVPSKTYEYLASGRPILAAVPDGDARDLLAAAGTALLCRPKDVDGIVAAIVEAYERSLIGRPAPLRAADLLSRYDYRNLAHQLAWVFDQLVGVPEPAELTAAV